MSRLCVVLFSLWLCAAVLIMHGCNPEPSHKWNNVTKNIRKKFPAVRHISTEELEKWLYDKKSVKPLILDRREPEEYAVSHLPGAFLAVNHKDALRIIAGEGTKRPVVIYCSVGYRSSELADQLRKRGIDEVYNLEGSIFKWANEGRKIYQGDKLTHRVHPFRSRWKILLDKKLWYAHQKS